MNERAGLFLILRLGGIRYLVMFLGLKNIIFFNLCDFYILVCGTKGRPVGRKEEKYE